MVEGEVVIVHVQEAEDDVAERDHPGRVQQRPAPAPRRAAAQAPGAPGERQRHPGQQPDGVGVGAVVDARGVAAGVEEDPGERDRAHRPGDHADDQPFAAEQRHPGGEDQWPEEVELLLDRERPEVAEQRRGLELFEVGLVAEDEVPVGEVEERGERVAAQRVDPVRLDDRRDDHRHRDEDADRRQQAPRPPQPEPADPDVAAAPVLAEQERGDQVAADHEEDVDAEEAARHPADARVVEEDGEHGDRPQRVDPRHVGEAVVLRPAHRVVNPSASLSQLLED